MDVVENVMDSYKTTGLWDGWRRVRVSRLGSEPGEYEYVTSSGKSYRVIVANPSDYYRKLKSLYGIRWLLGVTSSYYPRVLSRGWYLPKERIVLVSLSGDWRLRLAHEIGHCEGFRHVWEVGHVMHPYGCARGQSGPTCVCRQLLP